MEKRYMRNIPAVSEEEQALLKSRHAIVIGCGGLDGYIIEHLARLGVGHITAVDGDVFEESNLNRQLLCDTYNIGSSKAAAAAQRSAKVNPDVIFTPVTEFLSEANADRLLKDQDVVFDALDNAAARLVLEDACAKAGLYLVHGAICGRQVQAAVVSPGKNLLHDLYLGAAESDDSPEKKTALSFTAAVCASLEASEGLKILLGQPSDLTDTLLLFDLASMEINKIGF